MMVSIDKAIGFIKNQQRKDGGFWSWSSGDKDNFKKTKRYNSVFPTALILECLNLIDDSNEIKKMAADYLIKQKNESWSFNYWMRNGKENGTMPYPDDLDVTFCSLAALYNYNLKLIDGGAMAKIVTLLTIMEKKVGGPYKTWLVSEEANDIWKDVDLAVNSNVAYFLKLQEIELPNINKLIKSAIDKEKISSPYYPSIYPMVYFISRFLKSEKLIEIILKRKKNGYWENPLNTALATSALLNLGVDLKKIESSVNYLIDNQNKDGSWKADAFCIDPAINRKTYYSGSDFLTTAFVVEALNKFQAFREKKLVKKDKIGEGIHIEILKNVKKRIKIVGEIPKKNCRRSITLLPYIFCKSLGKNGKNISRDFLVKCGEATLLGWIAYTVYDDFWDGEGNKKMLPVANVCLRELSYVYNGILPNTGFDEVFNKVMDEMEMANLWEIDNCYDSKKLAEYGDYSQLAKKSLGYALGPVAILYKLGFNKNSREIKDIFSFFKYYLIARQLNDDAHDWEEDLKRNFINPVGREIFRKTKLKGKFREVFWNETVVNISNIILMNTVKARKKIRGIKLIEKPELILSVLESPEKSAEKTIDEQKQALKFIDGYGN